VTTAQKVKEIRDRLLKGQGGICLICNKPIERGLEVLDHQHENGRVRAVLHRSCNSLEGKIHNGIKRFAGLDTTEDNVEVYELFLRLTHFWQADYSQNPFHPSHKFAEHKEASLLRKAIKKGKKSGTMRKSTIKKKQARIKELQEIIKNKYS
jgi:hypothetical protein|tara:strand:- start:1413 stop:1868 length:456 start_codon:yes stop_codon:yes gene_type:complete